MSAERIVVVGSSGSGKSTLGRAMRDRYGHAVLELDGVHHLPGWTMKPEPAARREIESFMAREARWVIDGNYQRYRDLTWGGADTVVWLDLPRRVVMSSLARRTLGRLVRREVLWNGNRETWRNALSLDPQRSVLMFAWTQFARRREEYETMMSGTDWPHLRWIRLRNRREVRAYLRTAVTASKK